MSRDSRAEPLIKDRVPYVIKRGMAGSSLITRVVDPIEILSISDLDYNYYITKQIGPALNRVLNLMGLDCLMWYHSLISTLPLDNRLHQCE